MLDNLRNRILEFFPLLIFFTFLHFYYNGEIIKLSNSHTVFIIFFLCFLISNPNSFKFNNKKGYIIYIFAFLCFLSCFFSDDIISSFKRYIIVFIPFLIIFNTFLNIKDIDYLKNKFEKYFIFFVLFLLLYALIIFLFDYLRQYSYVESRFIFCSELKTHTVSVSNFLNLGQIYYTRGGIFQELNLYRPSSLISNTIGLSHLVLISLYLCFFQKKINIYLKLFIFIILLLGLVWTFSRINILIFCLLPLFYFLIKKKNYLLAFLYIKSFLFFLFLLIQYFLNKDFVFFDNSNLGNFLDRFEIYKLSLQYIHNFGIQGVGFGRSSEDFVMKLTNNFDYQFDNQNLSIPSVPLTMLVEVGILGLINFIILLPFLIKKNENFEKKEIKSIFIILIVVLLTQYFDISLFRFHPITFFFAIYMGMSCNDNMR